MILQLDNLPSKEKVKIEKMEALNPPEGWYGLGYLTFTMFVKNVSDDEFKVICEELMKRGYLLTPSRQRDDCDEGNKTYFISGRINPNMIFQFGLGNIEMQIQGAAINKIVVKVPPTIETKGHETNEEDKKLPSS